MLFTQLFRSLRWRSDRKRPTRAPCPRRSFAPQLMILEDRTVLNTYTVTNLANSGLGSLRQAVLDANAHPGADTVRFAPGLHGTIALASEIPITDAVTIDGPGANQITVSGSNATRVFNLSGSGTAVTIDNLTI